MKQATVRLGKVTPQSPFGSALVVCYACGEPLTQYIPGAYVNKGNWISGKLVPRPEPHASGLPRYGPERRSGHEQAHHVSPASTRREAEPDGTTLETTRGEWRAFTRSSIYVNCPACDRGQAVTPPDLRALGALARRRGSTTC